MYTTPCSGSSYVWYVKQNRRSKYSIVTDYIIVRFRKLKQLYELRQCRLRLVDLQHGVGWKRTIESDSKCHLIMRPNIVVDYRDSSMFFFHRLPFELAEQNSIKTGHVLRGECDLKMHVQNLHEVGPILSSYKAGTQKPLFRRFRNLTATLTASIFRMKCDIHNPASVLETTRGLWHRLKMSWTLIHKRLNLDLHFCQPSVNSAFYFIARLCK